MKFACACRILRRFCRIFVDACHRQHRCPLCSGGNRLEHRTVQSHRGTCLHNFFPSDILHRNPRSRALGEFVAPSHPAAMMGVTERHDHQTGFPAARNGGLHRLGSHPLAVSPSAVEHQDPAAVSDQGLPCRGAKSPPAVFLCSREASPRRDCHGRSDWRVPGVRPPGGLRSRHCRIGARSRVARS